MINRSFITITVLCSLLFTCSPQQQDDSRLLLSVADDLVREGNWSAADRLLKEVLTRSNDDLKVEASLRLGKLAFLMEDFEKSEMYFERLVQQANTTGEASYELGNLYYVYWAYGRSNSLDSAITLVQDAVQVAESRNDKVLLNQCFYRLGSIAQIQGKEDSAKSFFNQALTLAIASKDTAGIARSYTHLSEIFKNTNQIDSAIVYDQYAIELSRKTHDYFPMAFYLGNLAQTFDQLKKYKDAEMLVTEALFIADRLNNNLLSGRTYLIASDIYLHLNNKALALTLAEKAKRIGERHYPFYTTDADRLISAIQKINE